MEWMKKISSINEIAASSHFKSSSKKENEHKSAGNNLSISQNTRQAELFASSWACWCEWKIVQHLTRIFHFLL